MRTDLPCDAPGGPLRVLVVDNDRDGADSWAALLGLWGYHARVAYGGNAALAQSEGAPPDVMLMDLAMPLMSGFAVCTTVLERPRPPPLLIALTGLTGDAVRLHAWRSGFDHFFTKPLEPDTLRDLLRDAQDRKKEDVG